MKPRAGSRRKDSSGTAEPSYGEPACTSGRLVDGRPLFSTLSCVEKQLEGTVFVARRLVGFEDRTGCQWAACVWVAGEEALKDGLGGTGSPVVVVEPAVWENGQVTGGQAHGWCDGERQADLADICCGLGTWSWVARGSGLRVGTAIDADSWCCDRVAALGLPAWKGHIETDDARRHLRQVARTMVVGSPPCPTFSMAGQQRGWNDDRSQVALEFGRSHVVWGALFRP